MKRLLLIVLAVMILSGCGGKNPSATDTENTLPLQDDVVSLYVPQSAVEQQTGGAVRAYGLENDTYFGLYGIGSNLLVIGQKGMMVLSGAEGNVIASLETEDIRPNSVMDVTATGIAYYLPNSRQIVVRNPQLKSVTRLELPKEIVGSPCISLAKNEAYYSTGSEVRAMNMTTGISRLLRKQSSAAQALLGVHFDGTVLVCKQALSAVDAEPEYISTETGQTIRQGKVPDTLQTVGEQYFALWEDGTVLQNAFGKKTGTPQCLQVLHPPETDDGRAGVLTMGGIVDYVTTEGGLELSFYDFSTGKCTAQTLLPGVQSPAIVSSDGTNVWLLATDKEQTRQVLYRWDVTLSPKEGENICMGPLYTAENPDTQGLAQCRTQADAYEKLYGVKLLFWQDAAAVTGGHTVTSEHHPLVISNVMEQLKPVLEQFPNNFLQKTVEAGWIKLALVREIAGDTEWAQFWEGGDCWILLTPQTDFATALIQGIAYGVDSHVLGNSRELDTWNELNPEDFVYAYSEKAEDYAQYLTGDGRAFADMQSMTYPHEDRCRIFYYAMFSGNETMFRSPAMQAKLLRLCKGIREAYGLEKKTETYIWEQYLETSLAYVKE